jgi:hypothetical protein
MSIAYGSPNHTATSKLKDTMEFTLKTRGPSGLDHRMEQFVLLYNPQVTRLKR